MNSLMKSVPALLGLVLLSWHSWSQAQALLLTAPPRETPQVGEQMYAPLAKHLSELTGHDIRYRHPGNWLRYQRDMRRHKYDIVFDGPHFASWRIRHAGHSAVARLPGFLQFYLVARADNDAIVIPRDLAARRVCVIPPPNLSSLALLARTDGPAREPILEAARGGMKGVYQKLMSGACEAAMLRSSFFDKKLEPQQRDQLKIIYSSPQMPNQVITVGSVLSAQQQQKIAVSLISGEGVEATQAIVKRFAGQQTKAFIAVKPGEYDDYSDLLEGVILGWKPRD